MVVVFGLVAAVLYGSADFLGGAASRRARALSVLTVSAPAGAIIILAAALLDAGANAFYILATRAGMLGMAVVLTSLYPGVTVLLARVLLGERMRAVQRAGLCLAAIGVVLVTA
jgi:uncharacterized membrane protein